MTRNYTQHSKRSGVSERDVLDIRSLSATRSVRQIASDLNIPKSTVHDIITGKTWSHVPEPVTVYKNYTIYPDGRIKSNKVGQFMSTKMSRDGSLTVELTVNGNRKTISVATLVAKAFLKSKSSKLSFADGDKTNVHFTNIVTR